MKDTFLYDFRTGEFVMSGGSPMTATGRDALRVWIEKCLRTPYARYQIYRNKLYGANIEDLVIGKSYGYGFTAAELKREIESALLRNPDITAVTAVELTNAKDKLRIDITLETVYGEEVYTYDA